MIWFCGNKRGKRSVERQAHTFVDLLEAETGVPRDLLAGSDGWQDWLKKESHGGSTEVGLVVVVVHFVCCWHVK